MNIENRELESRLSTGAFKLPTRCKSTSLSGNLFILVAILANCRQLSSHLRCTEIVSSHRRCELIEHDLNIVPCLMQNYVICSSRYHMYGLGYGKWRKVVIKWLMSLNLFTTCMPSTNRKKLCQPNVDEVIVEKNWGRRLHLSGIYWYQLIQSSLPQQQRIYRDWPHWKH